jgi:hypothetical protein
MVMLLGCGFAVGASSVGGGVPLHLALKVLVGDVFTHPLPFLQCPFSNLAQSGTSSVLKADCQFGQVRNQAILLNLGSLRAIASPEHCLVFDHTR